MIQKIGLNLTVKNSSSKATNYQQHPDTPPNFEKSGCEEPKPTSELLHSYFVSFGQKKNNKNINSPTPSKVLDKMAEIEDNTSYYGEKLLSDAQNLAKKLSHKEVNQLHILRIGLENIKNYIDELDSGESSYDDESSFSTYNVIEEDVSKNIIKSREQRKKIKPIIEKELVLLDEKLSQIPKDGTVKKPNFSKDLLNDIYSLYQQDNDEDMCGDRLVHDDTIFSAAYLPNNDKVKKEITVPFRMELKDKIQIDNRPLSERIYLSFYDDKAENIWKNLAIGKNMVILHDKDSSPHYLVNSFLQMFEDKDNGFGKLNKNNTKIVNFNSNCEFDNSYFKKKLQEYGKNKNTNYVIVIDIMDSSLKSSLGVNEYNVSMFSNAPENVKFVMVADKDTFYNESNDRELNGFFDNAGEVSLPLMNMAQAQKMFKEQPKLMKGIEKQFSRPAIEKCVETANQLSGNYPEKAQKVMGLVSSYYIDKDKISLSDVQNYIKEAKEIFKTTENDSAVKMVFDTGIKLKDMVGTPSTKKEAKMIVERIKDKSIGTKGFLIYSQDGSVGAGRRYTAQAIAGEAKTPYIEINAVDFGTKDVDLFGGGNLSPEASMKKLFGMVKSQAETNPSKSAVLFIENFEYFSYGEMVSEYHEKAMSQLIREMNKAQEQGLNIVVMGSMSNPKYIDTATSKSFKFIDEIQIESPGDNKDARSEIINYYIKKKGIKLAGDEAEKNVTKKHIELLTEYSSYIEILTLLDKAKNVAKERKHKAIDKADFTEAYLQLTTGRPASAREPQYRKELLTSHECGHALNVMIMEELAKKENRPDHIGPVMNFMTLDPRGTYGGAVYYSNQVNLEYSFERIFSDLVVSFGGHSCEKYFYGQDGSCGITTDMQSATHIASVATAVMGQGKHFGKKSIEGMLIMSEKDKDTMNKDIDVMLTNARLVSDAITEVYEDFNKEFVKKYSSKVGTGECIVHREDFLKMLNEWRAKQPPEKQRQFELLDSTIHDVIEATKRGVKCLKEGE